MVAFVRSRFCFASILVPDLGCQLVVEVDSSDVGFRAMLSQWQKLPLCAFFLSCMTPAERNYLNGNFWGSRHLCIFCLLSTPTTSYLVGHKVWLSTWHSPSQVDSQKVGPKFNALITNEKTVDLVAVKLPRSMWFHPTFQVLRVSPMHEWLWQFHFLHLLTLLMLDRFMDFQRAAMFTSLGKRVPVFAGLEERFRILTLCRGIWRLQRLLLFLPETMAEELDRGKLSLPALCLFVVCPISCSHIRWLCGLLLLGLLTRDNYCVGYFLDFPWIYLLWQDHLSISITLRFLCAAFGLCVQLCH